MSDQHTTPTTFDLFILALSVFSLINIIWVIILPDGHQRNVVRSLIRFAQLRFRLTFSFGYTGLPKRRPIFCDKAAGWT